MEITSGQAGRLPGEFGRIGVLMGGPSSEREISLRSGRAVYAALKGLGIDAAAIDIATDKFEENAGLIESYKLDCAFLALHGRFGEDGGIQDVLDSIGIPYTGSGAQASRLAMDKAASRKVMQARGLSVPPYSILEKKFFRAGWNKEIDFSLPWVIKPVDAGSSIGLSIVDDLGALDTAVDSAFNFGERILIEKYIEGRELTAGILDESSLPLIEIIPRKPFFDYESKYKAGMTDYVVPAKLPETLAKEIKRRAFRAHRLLGCSGCSRVDIILTRDSAAFILELNSIPGLTETSLLPKAAKAAGIGFAELCIRLIELALRKSVRSR